jgi:hypothetical protein
VKDPFDDPKAAKKDKPNREFAVGGSFASCCLAAESSTPRSAQSLMTKQSWQVEFGHEGTALVKPSEVVD